MAEEKPVDILVLGGNGLVGSCVLSLAAGNPRVGRIAAPTRMPMPEALLSPKIVNPAVDYEKLDPEAFWWKADAVLCCLGSTMKKSGTKENFYRADHDYPLAAAKIAFARGSRAFGFVSARGADPESGNFYLSVKGKTERDISSVGFGSLLFVRPSVIAGKRREFRLLEEIAISALTVAGPVLPRKWQLNSPDNIARVLLQFALNPWSGAGIVESDQIA